MSPIEIHLRRMAGALDDAALESLGSRGLLRRAKRDLELGSSVRITGAEAAVLDLVVGPHVVRLPASGPAQASCSCPAGTTCQHILAAVLFLQSPADDAAAPPSTSKALDSSPASRPGALEEWLAISTEALREWAGAKDFASGLQLLNEHEATLTCDAHVRVRFATLNAECILPPSAGLDGAIVSSTNAFRKTPLVVAAVALLRRTHGAAEFPAASEPLSAATGAAHTRTEILESIVRALHGVTGSGLSRRSAVESRRWTGLATAAQGANLPRISAMLRSISDEIRLLLRRDARGDTQRLLERLATCHALASSLLDACAAPDPSLIGSHRSQYDDVGHLELEGIAAWPWRSASGYDGLSVLFWEPLSARWNVWSEARPRSQSGAFQPAQRYFAPGPWDGAGSPNQLSHSAVRLLHARRNRQFRLSSSSSSRALITNPSRGLPSGLTVHTEVASLRTLAATTHSIGLKDPDPLAGVVLVEPASWGARRFDPIRQTFEWTVRDASEQSIRLELAHDDQNQPAIEFLETCPVGELKGARIVARLIPEPTDFSLHPYALHYRNGNRVNLALDTLKQVPAQVPSPSTMEEVEWDPEDGATTTSSGSHAIDGLLTEVVDVLLAMAERGITGTPDNLVNSLRAQASRASQLQLDLLASTLRTLLGKPLTAASLLRCAHVTQVHREASQALRWPEEFAELARQEPHPGNPGP